MVEDNRNGMSQETWLKVVLIITAIFFPVIGLIAPALMWPTASGKRTAWWLFGISMLIMVLFILLPFVFVGGGYAVMPLNMR